MQVSHEQLSDGSIRICIIGEMDAIGCGETRPAFQQIIDESTEAMVALDLSQVTFLDSSGIGAIVFLFKRLRSKGSDLTIQCVSGQPRELLELLRIDQAINVDWNPDGMEKATS